MASFGIENKSGSIQKFNPANIKYRDNAITGFRTFLRGWRGDETEDEDEWIYQPFHPLYRQQEDNSQQFLQRNMYIGYNELEIEERQEHLNLQTNILYYTIPNEEFAGLIRKVTFSNLDNYEDLYLDVVDGLSELIPYGLGNSDIDAMFRTREAWMRVYNIEKRQQQCDHKKIPLSICEEEEHTTSPYYHITQSTEDSMNVNMITAGHFVISYFEGKESHLLPIIYDPAVLFGSMDSDLMNPIAPFDNSRLQKTKKKIKRRNSPHERSRIHEILSRKQVNDDDEEYL